MVPNSDGKYLLKMQRSGEEHKKCVVIDLDETLVHSSFKVSKLEFCHLSVSFFRFFVVYSMYL